jgi:glucose/mannose-6-phosphate isomerase
MNLDDLNNIHKLDSQDVFGQLKQTPDQLYDAWQMGQVLPLPDDSTPRQVIIAGMGGSAMGGELAAIIAEPHSTAPIIVHRGYGLPAWARGPETFVLAVSHSGETEETLSAYRQAAENGCRVLAITTGGTLAQLAYQQKHPVWMYVHDDGQGQPGHPRYAIGFLFGMVLAALHRLNLLPDPSADLQETLHALRNQMTNLLPEVQVMFNPAKRMAGQMVGRWVTVIAADALAPVAKRWKDQVCEVAKAWAQYDVLPEADHTTLAGLNNPESALTQTIALFLAGSSNHPRNRLRLEFTREIFMTQAVNTDTITGRGESLMAQMWTLLQFGDYTACYLAIAYGEDPSVTEVVSMMKHALSSTNP